MTYLINTDHPDHPQETADNIDQALHEAWRLNRRADLPVYITRETDDPEGEDGKSDPEPVATVTVTWAK